MQSMVVAPLLKDRFPQHEIHFLTKIQFVEMVDASPYVDKVWALGGKQGKGLGALWRLLQNIPFEDVEYFYDAHNNIRTWLIRLYLKWRLRQHKYIVAIRSKDRWKRFLLFTFRINLFPRPYRGMKSYVAPLIEWGIATETRSHAFNFAPQTQKNVSELLAENRMEERKFVALAPSAAWKMKRWPVVYWQRLIADLPQTRFIILAGPEDSFCQELVAMAPHRVVSFQGKFSLLESAYVLTLSQGLISADTGLLHFADLLGVRAWALIGPTAFGFPSHKNVTTLEVPLSCRPCSKDGRGKCSQSVYQKCMIEITPAMVESEIKKLTEIPGL